MLAFGFAAAYITDLQTQDDQMIHLFAE